MFDRDLDCLTDTPQALPLQAWRPADLESALATLPAPQSAFLRATGFTARAGQIGLLPGADGLEGAVLGLGEATGPAAFGPLATGLPPGTSWHLPPAMQADCLLGFARGAYRFDPYKSQPAPPGARLALSAEQRAIPALAAALSAARATWLARDLINSPANLLGPTELAHAARDVLARFGARTDIVTGSLLEHDYPVIHAVGSGSARPPCVLRAHWQGSKAGVDAPLVSLCGKGVTFDSGGYDLKPPAAMLRMKKDMGGAAITLGLARMVMQADLPLRLELRLGCVENMISGAAMRPLDIVKSRAGHSIEIGNTDAEGRLVLCDLLAEAATTQPRILMDFATLTGAARVALGPDLPALFCNNDDLASILQKSAEAEHDPIWRLPLWHGYNSWLETGAADINNVSEKPLAGAILAALFLQRFVPDGTNWAHFDVYAYNDGARPDAPPGGEAQALRAAYATLRHIAQDPGALAPGR